LILGADGFRRAYGSRNKPVTTITSHYQESNTQSETENLGKRLLNGKVFNEIATKAMRGALAEKATKWKCKVKPSESVKFIHGGSKQVVEFESTLSVCIST
jgi:hypothetical protein